MTADAMQSTALAKLFGGIAALFGKDSPTAGEVHVDVPLGSDGGKKPKKVKPLMFEQGATAKFSKASVCKVDESLGLVFGYAIVCNQDGEPYYDVQDDHIPEDAMLKASADFMENSRIAKEMHAGDQTGAVVFAFPMTSDIATALDITVKKTGLLIAMKPSDPSMLARFASGELTGFSIGGSRGLDEEAA